MPFQNWSLSNQIFFCILKIGQMVPNRKIRMQATELVTKQDLKRLEQYLQGLCTEGTSIRWPMRLKKRSAAEYMNTSRSQIDSWVNNGDLIPRFDKDPSQHPTTPAYFNKEDLDKLRWR